MENSRLNFKSPARGLRSWSPLMVFGMALVVLGSWIGPAVGQSPTTTDTVTQRPDAATTQPLPARLMEIYAGGVPKSAADLRLMDAYQQQLVQRVTAATVAVQVGPTQGSGVIVTGDGYVLTASHVARRPGMRARVILADGRQVRATTLGMNKNIDAGMLKIDQPATVIGKQAWPHATMGRDTDLHAGTWCMTLGHAGGFQPDRVQPGVRIGRILHISKRAIETDCTLVGGDSGGPLFDMRGNVIGINSRIGADLNKNIHVPVDTFRSTWKRLASGESWGDLANVVGHPKPAIGVMRAENSNEPIVDTVIANSPAQRAGIRPGDTITRFDGTPVGSFTQLAQLVQKHAPGDEVNIEILRDGRLLKIKLVLGFLPVPKP